MEKNYPKMLTSTSCWSDLLSIGWSLSAQVPFSEPLASTTTKIRSIIPRKLDAARPQLSGVAGQHKKENNFTKKQWTQSLRNLLCSQSVFWRLLRAISIKFPLWWRHRQKCLINFTYATEWNWKSWNFGRDPCEKKWTDEVRPPPLGHNFRMTTLSGDAWKKESIWDPWEFAPSGCPGAKRILCESE